MKKLFLLSTLLGLTACSTPSAYTEQKYLTGEPDPAEKAEKIFDALKRNDNLAKQSVSRFDKEGKTNIYPTGVEIEMAPFTRPLVVARA